MIWPFWLQVPIIGVIYDEALLRLMHTSVAVTAGTFLVAVLLFHPMPTRRRCTVVEPPTIAHPLYCAFAVAAVTSAVFNWIASGAISLGMTAQREIFLQEWSR